MFFKWKETEIRFKIVVKIFLLTLFVLNVCKPQSLKIPKDTLVVKLSQITVTATRSSEEVMEIPYAVSILHRKDLSGIRGYGFDEVLTGVPGVLAQSRYGNQDVRIVIRGFGARGAGDRSNSGTSRGIRVMIDGIPETEPDGRTAFDQVDLSVADNIEVIRSNASAVWGNAAGGVINLSTVPSEEGNSFSLRALAGSYGYNSLQFNGVNNFEKGKIFASVSNSNYEGWRSHSGSYRTLFNLGFISNLDNDTKLGVFASAASNIFHIPGPLTQKQFDSDPSKANSVYLQRDERRINRLGKIGIEVNHYFNEENSVSGMFFVNPKYLQRSERGTFRDFTRYHLGGNLIYNWTTNFSSSVLNKFIAGGDDAYQDGAILFYSLSPTNWRGTTLTDNKREGANTMGLFIQDEVIFNDKLSLIFGARYDNVTYYNESFITAGYGLQTRSFEKVSPKIGMTYRISETESLYANIGSGVEVPAGNETDPAGTYGQDKIYLINPLLDPIISTTYEIGTKRFMFFDKGSFINSLSYDLALYSIDVVNDIIPYRGGKFYFTAGKTKRMGIEIGARLKFANEFSFSGAFTFSDNKYKEYLVDSVHYDPKKAGRFASYTNNEVAGIPSMFYNCKLNYEPAMLNGLFVSLDINSIGKYFADDANTLSVPAFSVIGASIGINKPVHLAGKLSFTGFITINNIFDSRYAASAFINPDVLNNEAVFLEPGVPRNIVLSVTLHY